MSKLSTILLLVVSALVACRPLLGDDAQAWAARIDERLVTRQETLGVLPAQVVDDATFLRRVTLDLIGRVPTVAEVRDYLADASADKARRAVARLTQSPLFAQRWAIVWRCAWIPQADTPQFSFLAAETQRWLADELHRRTSHDVLVRQLLEVVPTDGPGSGSGLHVPQVLLVAGELKPENLAAISARAFLGVNLDCAQCHDHPFARWTRDEFWQTAAFFASPDEQRPSETLQIRIPETERTVKAKLLDDQPVVWPAPLRRESGRKVLAAWVTARKPVLRAARGEYRLAQLFGAGLVEPLDDLARDDPLGDPEHLAILAEEATAAGLDMARLVEACVLTNAYRSETSGLATRSDRLTTPEDERYSFAECRSVRSTANNFSIAFARPPVSPRCAMIWPAMKPKLRGGSLPRSFALIELKMRRGACCNR
ncbi:MAG: DUF1549 domain-containing protein [Pirellulales bacterium]